MIVIHVKLDNKLNPQHSANDIIEENCNRCVLLRKAEAHLVSGVMAVEHICRENILAGSHLMGWVRCTEN